MLEAMLGGGLTDGGWEWLDMILTFRRLGTGWRYDMP